MGVGHTESRPVTVSLGFNHTGLDYGESIYTDPGSPDPIGTFESREHTHGVTFAAGLMDIVGVGVGMKQVEVDLGPDFGPGFGARSRVHAFDYGALARTPRFPFRKAGDAEPIWNIALTGGLSWLNRGKETFFAEYGAGDPLPKVRRESVGFDLNFLPADALFHPSSPWLSRLLRDVHLVSVSAALGREKDLLAGTGDIPDSILAQLSRNSREGITNYRGMEIRFLDSIAVRVGRVNDEAGQIIDNTYGWGLSILGKAGVDYARIPQFRELENVVKWSFWIRFPFDEAT
jgi:hypothetical protein